MDKVTAVVTVMSRLNFDCFVVSIGGKEQDFLLNELDKMHELLDGYKEIWWKKGKNVFTGKEISDNFYHSMIKRYEEVK